VRWGCAEVRGNGDDAFVTYQAWWRGDHIALRHDGGGGDEEGGDGEEAGELHFVGGGGFVGIGVLG